TLGAKLSNAEPMKPDASKSGRLSPGGGGGAVGAPHVMTCGRPEGPTFAVVSVRPPASTMMTDPSYNGSPRLTTSGARWVTVTLRIASGSSSAMTTDSGVNAPDKVMMIEQSPAIGWATAAVPAG